MKAGIQSKKHSMFGGKSKMASLMLLSISCLVVSNLSVAEPDSITSRPSEDCPLNSGGPSLLNTSWRLHSVYGNIIPPEVNIMMKVNSNTLTGFAGCNNYSANFKQVGYTGFRITKIIRGEKQCAILRPRPGAPTINIGSLEGGYLRTIGRMGSVQQINDQLVFYNRNGQQGVIFRKPLPESEN
jgi:hypothetical protein